MRTPGAYEIRPSILGISFDGLAISGIVNEFVNVATVLRDGRYRVLLDLGYDITLGRTKNLGWEYLPDWVQRIRCIGDTPPAGYCAELVEQAQDLVAGGTAIAATAEYNTICRELAARLVETFTRENVRILIVENGTLPDNPVFTEAVYLAITEYGSGANLGKFVLWRDHDLMWSVEPQLYGEYPYSGVRKPEPNNYIHYVVTSEWMRRRIQAWARSITSHVIPYRFFSPAVRNAPTQSLRSAYGIPEHAYLVARCTRVVPQKSIERDLRLLHEIQIRLSTAGNPRKVYLVVAGLTRRIPRNSTACARLSGHFRLQDKWSGRTDFFRSTRRLIRTAEAAASPFAICWPKPI
jgi:hypothetical protein